MFMPGITKTEDTFAAYYTPPWQRALSLVIIEVLAYEANFSYIATGY